MKEKLDSLEYTEVVMTEATNAPALDSVLLRGFPPQHLPPDRRGKFQRAMRAFDRLGRLHRETGQVYIHEPSLRALLQDRDLCPAWLGDELIERAKNNLGPKYFTSDERGMVPLKWLEVGDRVPAVRPQTDATYEQLGLTASSTADDIKASVKQRLSDLPPEVFEGDALKTRVDQLMRNEPTEAGLEAVRGFWDVYYCLERKIGFWALITLVGLIIVAISCVAATLVAWWACFWLPALIWIGITTFITLVACILGWG